MTAYFSRQGEALTESKLGDELFVLSKIAGGMKDGIGETLRKQLNNLQLKSLDAFLLHLPPRGKDGFPGTVEAWREMEKLKDEGLVKSIGVSNFLASDIKEIYEAKPKHPIEINEIEFVRICRDAGI